MVKEGESETVWPRAFESASRFAGWIAVGVGAAVLLGWVLDLPLLKSLHPDLASMKANTALALLLLGGSLRFQQLPAGGTTRDRSRLGKALAVAAMTLAGLTLLQYLLDWDSGLDVFLFADPESVAMRFPPGRMAPTTAVLLLLAAGALTCLDARLPRRVPYPAEGLALLCGCLSFLAVAGYVYGVRSLYSVGPFASVALHTALTFFALSAGILAARPRRGLVGLVTSKGPAGALARRLLPWALVIPVTLGWLRLRGQQLELYGFEFGLALFAISSVICFVTVILWSARAVQAADRVRLEAERRLRESEQDLAITLFSIGDGVITTDAQGRVTRMNAVAEELTGYDLDMALGKPLADVFRILNEDTHMPVESPVERVLRDGIVVGLANHTELVTRDGAKLPIADSGAPIRDADGGIRGVVLVFRDQTEERTAERALRESDARKGAILEAALDCIVSMDETGSITEFNPSAEKTFGYSRAEAMGRPLVELLVPPAFREQHLAGLRRYLDSGVGPILGKRLEMQGLRADGSEVPVELAVVATRNGGPPLFTAYMRDLTERKRAEETLRASQALGVETALVAEKHSLDRERAEAALRDAEEQLRQSQKMEAVGTLAGGIAHDFNNLLSVILSYADLLLSDLKATDPMRPDLEQISRAGQRANDLTRQLLAFSRRQVLQPKVVDLNQIVSALAGMLQRLIGEDVELVTIPTSGLDPVFVDPGQIEQVILNLVVNARDAMPRGGKLTIELTNVELGDAYAAQHLDVAPGHYVMLSVSDTGTGMDRATQARIFEPFYTTKEQGKGTGLGLSTVFGIVKQSGGNVWVYSEPLKGTTFKIYFPRASATPPPAERLSRPVQARGGSETVLLVEDDEQVRALAHTILRRHGYRVLESASGGDALLLCEQHTGTIDVLLTDVVMPRMSGRQLAARLGLVRPAMKVVFMSGYTDDAIVHHGILEAEMHFVQKPLLPNQLLAKLREVLDG